MANEQPIRTLNTLISIFKLFADNHGYKPTFGYGDYTDLGEKEIPRYPLFFVHNGGGKLNNKTVEFNFKIIAADLQNDARTNVLDIQSDMLGLITHFRTWLHKEENLSYIEVLENNSFNPFANRFGDNLAGYVLDLNIKVTWPYSVCNIPGLGSLALTSTGGATIISPFSTGTNLNFYAVTNSGSVPEPVPYSLSVIQSGNNVTYTLLYNDIIAP
jgi:hypothetical protein